MDAGDMPQTQPAGALGPPHRPPPTAVGTDTPEPPVPPRPPRRHRLVRVEREVRVGPDLRGLVHATLGALDRVADRVAAELGLRSSGRGPGM